MTNTRISAIAPNYAESVRDLEDLAAEFGPFKGRFLYKAPRDWINIAIEEIETNPKLDVVSTAKLKEFKRRIESQGYLVNPWGKVETRDWADAVASQREKGHQFEYVVKHRDSPEPDDALSWEDCFSDLRDPDHAKHQWVIQGRIAEYREAMQPLLYNASNVFLIDRFFDPLSSGMHLLKFVLHDLKAISRCSTLNIISEKRSVDPESAEQYFADLEQSLIAEYEGSRPKNFILKWHILWNDKRFIERDSSYFEAHDRYFLTNQGGIQLGNGFETRKANVNDQYFANYLSKPTFEKTFARFNLVAQGVGSIGKLGSRRVAHLEVS